MLIESLPIKGAWISVSDLHLDNRGAFSEWFKLDELHEATKYKFQVSQANISQSRENVIRGLHFSLSKDGQAKYVRCIKGAILDVIVDIRVGSPTFGLWHSEILSSESGRSILVGPNLAHGFLSLESETIVSYLLTSKYDPDKEFEIDAFDNAIAIDWKMDKTKALRSPKDSAAPDMESLLIQNLLPKFNSTI